MNQLLGSLEGLGYIARSDTPEEGRARIIPFAESIRPELGGKVTIIGAIGGSKLQVPKSTAFPVAFPLAFYILLAEGFGEFDVRISVKGPNGKPLLEATPIGHLKQAEDQVLQLLLNLGMFSAPSVGRYRVDIFLDDKVYTEEFDVSLGTGYTVFA